MHYLGMGDSFSVCLYIKYVSHKTAKTTYRLGTILKINITAVIITLRKWINGVRIQ